jgi:ligand-binding sensor domain-containing protein/signal transduction histidine kinase
MKRSFVLVILLTLALGTNSRAQSSWMQFKSSLSSEDETPIQIECILKDNRGYMWFSGSMGIYRYDGTHVYHYAKKELSKNAFTSQGAWLMFEDSNHILWTCTTSGALMRYDPALDQFLLMNDTSTSLRKPAYSFAEDSEGNFWIGTMGSGLYRYHPQKKEMEHFTKSSDPTSISDDYITSIAKDSKGNLWLGTTGGLCYLDVKSKSITRLKLVNENAEDVYRYRVIRGLHIANDGLLYITTYGGMHVYDMKRQTNKHLLHNPSDSKSLSHNSTFSITEDKQGNLWITSYGGGLNKYSIRDQSFFSWKKDSSNPYSISSNNIFEIYCDDREILWLGIADNKLCYVDLKAKPFHRIQHTQQSNSIQSGWARTIFQENDSVFWIGYNGNGIDRYNINTGKATNFKNEPLNPNSLGHNTVSGISKDSKGNLWIGTEGGGINRYDVNKKEFTRFTSNEKKNSIQNNAVSSLLVDDEDNIWVSMFRGGLNVYNPRENRFYAFNDDSLSATIHASLSGIRHMMKVNGDIWLSTANGVVVYDNKKKIFVKIEIAEGNLVPSQASRNVEIFSFSHDAVLVRDDQNTVYTVQYEAADKISKRYLFKGPETEFYNSIIADRNGDLWISTTKGILNVNPKTGVMRQFTADMGLFASGVDNNLFVDNSGRMFIASLDGINWFYPNEIVKSDVTAPVLLTGLRVFNSRVPIGQSSDDSLRLKRHISLLDKIELTHNHSFFSIEFSSQDYAGQDKIQYAYKMDGFDKDWIYSGNLRFASYTNLDPGTYMFRVKSANPDGQWNETDTTIPVIIQPPFWQTIWFVGLCILALAAVLLLIHYYRLEQALKVQRVRNKIASDLHDEVGSNLTRISLYADLAQKEAHDGSNKPYLTSISSLSRDSVSMMSDIIWSVDISSDSVSSLILRMKDFAFEALQAQHIEIDFVEKNLNQDKVLDPVLKQNLYLIFKESVTNIIKHADATKVTVQLVNENNRFRLSIHDNGKGIVRTKEKGNGLSNMQRRAKSLNAKLNIQSDHGTLISLEMDYL